MPLAIALLIFSCTQEPLREPQSRGDAPEFEPETPVLKRLSSEQYANTIRDLFGDDLAMPTSLEPDTAVSGLLAVGSAVNGLSSWGVERYEDAAFNLAEQIVSKADPYWFPCTSEFAFDDDCAREILEPMGLHTWRRPLEIGELETLVDLAHSAGTTLDSFDAGLNYAIAALLQSPHFLYRIEIGELDPEDPTIRRYTDWEMASRLSYFLWNTTPDTELLDAAGAGTLTTAAGLLHQVDRMLADPAAEEGVRSLFSDMLSLYELEDISKDPEVFLFWSSDLIDSAHEETLLTIQSHVFDDQGDYRELFTTRRTYLNRTLAALYNVPAPTE